MGQFPAAYNPKKQSAKQVAKPSPYHWEGQTPYGSNAHTPPGISLEKELPTISPLNQVLGQSNAGFTSHYSGPLRSTYDLFLALKLYSLVTYDQHPRASE